MPSHVSIKLRVAEAFGGWLRQIVRRMATPNFSSTCDYAAENEVLEMVHTSQVTPLDEVLGQETREQVQAGLEKLGQLDRAYLRSVLHRWSNSDRDAADFDAPIGTIKADCTSPAATGT